MLIKFENKQLCHNFNRNTGNILLYMESSNIVLDNESKSLRTIELNGKQPFEMLFCLTTRAVKLTLKF